jgi:hypothetical protein
MPIMQPSALSPYAGVSMDLGLGAQAKQDADDEAERIRKKKMQDQMAGQNGAMTPNSAAYLSLLGNQF